jgi:cytochrome c oxidase assembly factor 2
MRRDRDLIRSMPPLARLGAALCGGLHFLHHHHPIVAHHPPRTRTPLRIRPASQLHWYVLILACGSPPSDAASPNASTVRAIATMPPHLHPRSRMTTSLFTTTLMVSFLVVATPHLLPCPVDPRTLTDSADPDALSGEPRRRRRRRIPRDEASNNAVGDERQKADGADEWARPKRECPVPKPSGLIGQVLGLRKDADDAEEPPSIARQVQIARRTAQGSDGGRT